ncbi:MAG: maltokinase N-terminal cap-like domain-containing protein [Gemmatimonadaceae bacterium]
MTAPDFGERLQAISTAEWTAWLHQQRWFGAKAADPSRVRVGLLLPFEHEGHRWAVVRLDVKVGGAVRWYQVILADEPRAGGAIVPALADPAFRRFLVDAFARRWAVERGSTRWAAVPAGQTPLIVPPDAPVELGRAEQSNTSLMVGDLAILKIFRRIEPGAHPDVEMTEFLTTRHAFPYTPTLLGTLVLEDAGERTIAGMLQELVPGARDAWEYALEEARPWFTGGAGGKVVPFAADARRIGRITRELHEVLASDDEDEDFAPEPAASEDVEGWGAATRAQVDAALDLLAAQLQRGSGIPAERVSEAKAVLARRGHYHDRIEELVEEVEDDAGFMIRLHGDYHLGQLLHSAGGEFMIIDFEGEPSRPLAHRRRKASPLRDVAGMLRSFAYAAATLAAESTADMATREVATGRWERAVRAAFLEGYLGERDEEASDFLPEDPGHVQALVSLFEMEKVFYELAYELNNRPAWMGIPLRGIARVTGI